MLRDEVQGNCVGGAASFFDGSTRLSRGGALSNTVDSKLFTCSFWFRLEEITSSQEIISQLGNVVSINAANKVAITLVNSSSVPILAATGDTVLTQDGLWHHAAITVDMANQGTSSIYLDGALETETWTTFTDDTIDFTQAQMTVGASIAGANTFAGDLAELYWNPGENVDLSTLITDYRTTGGIPAYLGGQGEIPSGSQPVFYMPYADGTNLGSGGAFTVAAGTLADAHMPPNRIYQTGSIYSGTKDITSSWLTEKLATRVNTVKVSGGDVAVNLGWGTTETEASATKVTIPSGNTAYVATDAVYVGWQNTTGTFELEQSVAY